LNGVFGWAACRLKTLWGFPGAGSCSGDKIPAVTPYSFQMANNVFISIVGIVFFCIFGSDKSIYIAWYTLYKKIEFLSKFYARKRTFLKQQSSPDL